MSTVTRSEAAAIRKMVSEAAQNTAEHLWSLGEGVYKARFSLDAETKDPVWQAWGYESYKDYLRTEVYQYVNPATVYNAVAAYKTFAVSMRTHRPLARKISVHKLVLFSGLVREENVFKWLKFAETHKYTQVRDAAKIARIYPALKDDPEKCHARALRLASLPKVSRARSGKGTLILGGISGPQERTFHWVQALVRTVKRNHKLSMARCLAEMAEQFKRLVERGQAGHGWDLPAVEVTSAAE